MNFLCYIGPGAGFAVMGSFLIFFGALLLGMLILLSLPFRLLAALFRRGPHGRFRRCVVMGLDGMDPRRARRLMEAGRLPNFKALAGQGSFSPLGSTCPPISPVAWSTFSTGVNPGKHGIYDFLTRDFNSYLPELSSTRLVKDRKGRPETVLLRKSQPFWKALGERGVPCTVLRVPLTYPPEPFRGRALSAMCAPDLRGTQGEFTLFEEDGAAGSFTGGRRIRVSRQDGLVRCALPGPTLDGHTLEASLEVKWKAGNNLKARLLAGGAPVRLRVGEYTPWISLTFRQGRRRVRGIARFLPLALEPRFRLYVTPVNIDPGHPAMPVAWPASFSVYLSRLIGPYATLGLAEDTWGLTAGVLSDEQFERQTLDIHRERERMFFEALRLTRRGVLVCVFDITDRMQHMFMRRMEEEPVSTDPAADARIDATYELCDAMLGRLRRRLGRRDLLLVLSDHGFTTFRRCVHVNAWLREQGYLVEKEQTEGTSDYFAHVDWSRTRAYSFGLAGVYLNLRGREAQGIVESGAQADALKRELAAKLAELNDSATGERAVRTVYDGAAVYTGPYTQRAPDLVVGWHSGYRHSWDTAVGGTAGAVFSDNDSKWCGDHCVDRLEVPGVLFSNRRLVFGAGGPHLADVAPTLLKLWNLPVPGYMDGNGWQLEGKSNV